MLNKLLKLTPRLQCVAGFIDKGATVADIGTDHGLLPVYLVLKKLALNVIASDISGNSLSSAIRNAELYGVSKLITFVRAAGLDDISDGDADTIVIAGVGGETIVNILDRAPWTRNRNVRCVLQPQSKLGELCYWLADNGYIISDAELTCDKGRYYCVVLVIWEGQNNDSGKATDSASAGIAFPHSIASCESGLYTLLVRKCDPLAEPFFDVQLHKINRALRGIEHSNRHPPDYLKNMHAKITCLKEECKKW